MHSVGLDATKSRKHHTKDRTTPSFRRRLDFLWLEITSRCNLECSHCYADSGPHQDLKGEMGRGDWLRVIGAAAKEGCTALQFIGGEPTLHPDLELMAEAAHEHSFEFIEVFSNLTSLTPKRLDRFSGYGIKLACSFYSEDPETHDNITRRTGSHKQTVRSIRMAVEAGIGLRVGVIEMDSNKGHYAATRSYLESIGVSDIGLDRVRKVGRGTFDVLAHTSTSRKKHLCGQCWKGKLCVAASGAVFPCIMARDCEVGNAKKQSIEEIVRGSLLAKFRTEIREDTDRLRRTPEIFACRPNACNPDMICHPDQGCYPDNMCYPDNCQPD